MPFAVFRQHQRKLLAVFAIMAMFAFVLSDSLPRWIRAGAVSDSDSVVADVFNRPVRRSDLALMNEKRQNANRFMMYNNRGPNFFGGSTRAELLDAIILKHEADRLGIPETAEFARQWVDQQTFGAMNSTTFDYILSKFDRRVGGEQLLIDLAGQIRLIMARQEVASPLLTPLDVFRNYRDQTERTSFKAVPFVVDSFVDTVPSPTESELRDYYDKYKADLPDPMSPDPGFKVPRKVRIEFLGIDSNAVAKRIKEKLPEDELKAYYESKKTDFPMDPGLPPDLFLGEPKLTPPRYLPLSEIREAMADALAREKAEEEVQDTFGKIRDEVVDKFGDAYQDKLADIEEAKKEGRDVSSITLPKPEDLAGIARKYGLTHEITPLLDRRAAEQAGRISLARTGTGRATGGRPFAEVAFDPKTVLYSGFELADNLLGDRFLARKTADEPAHVAPLDEIRGQVIAAWKLAKARPLARKAAEEFAAKVKADGGTIKGLTADNRPVLAIDSATKMKAGMPVPSQFEMSRFERGPATLASFPQLPDAGPALIDAMFALKPGETAVEPDKPVKTYYALALEKRDPVSYMALMGPTGSLSSYWSETQMDMLRKSYTQGMARLREAANLKMTVAAEEDEAPEADNPG